jgi:hypothetical protein
MRCLASVDSQTNAAQGKNRTGRPARELGCPLSVAGRVGTQGRGWPGLAVHFLRRTLMRIAALTAAPIALTAALAAPLPALALDAACQRVADASIKRFDAPAYHSRQKLETGTNEMIKIDGNFYMRHPKMAWRKAPPMINVAFLKKTAKETEALLIACEREKRDSVAGVAADIYRFTVKDPTGTAKEPLTSRVWIGVDDGLPYREVGSGFDGTTTYVGVKAPL